jgi:hypothetical protein
MEYSSATPLLYTISCYINFVWKEGTVDGKTALTTIDEKLLLQWKQITWGAKVQDSAILFSTANWLLIISSQRADNLLVVKRKEAV